MITVSEFQALPDAEQAELLISLIGDRPVLANLSIVGDIETIRPDRPYAICVHNYVHKKAGAVTIKEKQ